MLDKGPTFFTYINSLEIELCGNITNLYSANNLRILYLVKIYDLIKMSERFILFATFMVFKLSQNDAQLCKKSLSTVG